jgi:hypothetical protein
MGRLKMKRTYYVLIELKYFKNIKNIIPLWITLEK